MDASKRDEILEKSSLTRLNPIKGICTIKSSFPYDSDISYMTLNDLIVLWLKYLLAHKRGDDRWLIAN